jgi:6-phosphofructokinase 1
MKKIAVLTSGGDAPGMNAAIRSVVRTAVDQNVLVCGVRRGYAGLIEGDFVRLTARDVSGIIELSGTILETARSAAFRTPDGIAKAVKALEAEAVDGLIAIGGNGSQCGAYDLVRAGVPVNGVASTIDNDLAGTDITIGVDSALNVVLEAIDRLRVTATSHHRMFIVEVMGRDCGYLALAAGLAGGAEVIVTPEHDLSPEAVIELIHEAGRRGKKRAMVVVAEGNHNAAIALYQRLAEDPDCGFEPRLTILGHVQRGGRPSAFDRLLATRLANRATELLLDGRSGFLVGTINGQVTATPLAQVAGKTKPLPADLLRLAETMKL